MRLHRAFEKYAAVLKIDRPTALQSGICRETHSTQKIS